MSSPTTREALADACQACQELAHALGPALTPSQVRNLRRLVLGLSGLAMDMPARGLTETLSDLAKTLDLAPTHTEPAMFARAYKS